MNRLLMAAILASGTALTTGAAAFGEPAAPAGIVTSVNLKSLKAIFDAAGISASIGAEGDVHYVMSTLGANPVFVIPQGCANSDPNGDCAGVSILSGIWPSARSIDEVAAHGALPRVSAVLPGSRAGTYLMRYTIVVGYGVGPRFIEGALVQFGQEMDELGGFLSAGTTAPAGTTPGGASPTPTTSDSGFSAVPDLAGLSHGPVSAEGGAAFTLGTLKP